MFIAHLPAGYLLTKFLIKQKEVSSYTKQQHWALLFIACWEVFCLTSICSISFSLITGNTGTTVTGPTYPITGQPFS